MAYLLDTNVLVRMTNLTDPRSTVAIQAIFDLHQRGEVLHITPQNLVEFRNVATRPLTANGLGLSAAEVEARVAVFEATFPLLVETPDIYPAWKALVSAAGVIGKRVHDARFVAVCHAHRVSHFMTFNVGHFTTLSAFAPGVVVVDPARV
ncbi:MAG: PIN domain-containing protein [Gemmataceae bacterium]|nr:PIN domain-containing protein [Gemmataceae bacterium]